MSIPTFAEYLNEAEGSKYHVVAVNRPGPGQIRPVAKDELDLTDKQVAWLEKYGKYETIQGEKLLVLDRELKAKSKIKTPNINVAGRTSGYVDLVFMKK